MACEIVSIQIADFGEQRWTEYIVVIVAELATVVEITAVVGTTVLSIDRKSRRGYGCRDEGDESCGGSYGSGRSCNRSRNTCDNAKIRQPSCYMLKPGRYIHITRYYCKTEAWGGACRIE